jgi:fibrillarin-like rRNA methylase
MNKKIISAVFGPQYVSLLEKKNKKKREFCHNDIMDLITRVETRRINISSLLGDTIKEKYESIYVKLVELTNELGKSGNYYPDVIIADEFLSSVFECACSSSGYFKPRSLLYNEEIVKVKNVGYRWDLYKDKSLPADTMLLTNKNLVRGIVVKTNFSALYP